MEVMRHLADSCVVDAETEEMSWTVSSMRPKNITLHSPIP